ncbi:hypothetical protein [Geomicrobium sediminis]|uniref:Uncharacterized protein n=1 Tax=Geomicrobium sediminis TaxID=1347788 RepID=A0ABS2P6R6_9BACL|nr:hypothetical protein [Geomicrobium sediminis]MBM7631089.1 hypothetical protein [Geomicrobium sediminis]
MQDIQLHGITAGSNMRGRRHFKIFVQADEPSANNIGDIWIVTDQAINEIKTTGRQPQSPRRDDVWVRLNNLEYELSLDKANDLFYEGTVHTLYYDTTEESLVSELTDDNLLLWENPSTKAYGRPSHVHKWDRDNVRWNRLEAYTWNGEEWEQISSLTFYLYEEGTLHEPWELYRTGDAATWRATVEFRDDHMYLSGGAQANSQPGTGYQTGHGNAVTANPIDVTNLTTLHLRYTLTVFGGQGRMYISDVASSPSQGNSLLYARLDNNRDKDEWYSFDVSSLTGEAYLHFSAWASLGFSANNGYARLNVYEVYFE